ncbi:hypothetical protein CEXT_604741 [Caerostris extrusa]|uniref:Uncharacterized protein n=1 Tax=Caerostris extrusa TaxID=172846 RepID=A0AAV4W989_CAEEX|nr:hypothetical protein CEXT_604741 [Caerostris extrusa]
MAAEDERLSRKLKDYCAKESEKSSVNTSVTEKDPNEIILYTGAHGHHVQTALHLDTVNSADQQKIQKSSALVNDWGMFKRKENAHLKQIVQEIYFLEENTLYYKYNNQKYAPDTNLSMHHLKLENDIEPVKPGYFP